MSACRLLFLAAVGVFVLAALLDASPAWAQAGVVLTGVGPVNRSMAGASTAAPIDATGALYWNPASISGLPQSEIAFGLELLYPHTNLSSSVPANALGAELPPAGAAWSDAEHSRLAHLPRFTRW
jgi:long-chain fatty acid transport protein